MNTNDIPTEELVFDYQAAVADLYWALFAKGLGVETLPTGTIQERIDGDKAMMAKITAILKDRGYVKVAAELEGTWHT